ncbi:hypothetical protein PL263_03055 [Methylomonas sp. EFPC3]|uniref:hypothetical protein n=1 Tax=Methylomonas sp. EFPC3 TaxID=3021710 RepID=UPI0024167393|nr:hypothetical protein [Methylomonas sp. EFPC3]WFP51016.1 hypothetical protein PL263_03055 [Methylomonas sp. EFPC3]
MYFAKDFVETAEGLIFAAVSSGLEQGKVLCFLRYLRVDGRWRKVGTDFANDFLRQSYPHYLHYSAVIDADVHAVPASAIVRHYQPRKQLQALLRQQPADEVSADLQHLCRLFAENGLALELFGVTGSLLVGVQNRDSDIDLVCYDRDEFHRARYTVQALIAQDRLQALNDADWLEAYRRRACDFALDDYIWHEQRKYNKGMINQRKFDLSLLSEADSTTANYRKLDFARIEAEVADDRFSFDYPACFALKHAEIDSVVSFTATFNGQAQQGEWIQAAGWVEVDEHGRKRLVVGSTREAIGEYIKVLR